MAKSVVLLSSGLDSTVNLFEARQKTDVALALTFDYGQKAAVREVECSRSLAQHVGVPHKVVALPWFKDFNASSLLVADQAVPTGAQVDIQSHEQSLRTAKSVWVPNRNGIFLNIAAGFAEALGAGEVIPGFNAEEASTFPDNSQKFMDELTRSLALSTANHVRVESYTVDLQKVDIVKRGEKLKVPWQKIWPCYFSKQKWCGECESCLRSKRAFAAAGVNVQGLYLKE